MYGNVQDCRQLIQEKKTVRPLDKDCMAYMRNAQRSTHELKGPVGLYVLVRGALDSIMHFEKHFTPSFVVMETSITFYPQEI